MDAANRTGFGINNSDTYHGLRESELENLLEEVDPEGFIPMKCNATFIVSEDLRITHEEKKDIARLPIIRDTRVNQKLSENTLLGCISKEARDRKKPITRRLNSGAIACAVPVFSAGYMKGIVVFFYTELNEDELVERIGEIADTTLNDAYLKAQGFDKVTPHTRDTLAKDAPITLEEYEKFAIINAGEALKWNISKMARTLGIGRNTLYYKMKKYEIG